ncbi:MAG: hypothetical protein WC325_12380, partial [Candidatus Bathyarchaeia archaeon]
MAVPQQKGLRRKPRFFAAASPDDGAQDILGLTVPSKFNYNPQEEKYKYSYVPIIDILDSKPDPRDSTRFWILYKLGKKEDLEIPSWQLWQGGDGKLLDLYLRHPDNSEPSLFLRELKECQHLPSYNAQLISANIHRQTSEISISKLKKATDEISHMRDMAVRQRAEYQALQYQYNEINLSFRDREKQASELQAKLSYMENTLQKTLELEVTGKDW